MPEDHLSPNRIRELFDYDPETGRLDWKVLHRTRKNPAGYLTPYGYQRVSIDGFRCFAHRIAWFHFYGKPPKGEIDHINGIRWDNRIANLREVTDTENARNSAIPRNNTSGVAGVSWDGEARKWVVMISAENRKKTVGRFRVFEDAIACRKAAEKALGYHENHGRSSVSSRVG